MAESTREPSRWKSSWWRPLVGIDVRSLAALRIGLASILIYDLITRLADLEAHYADSGLLPRADLLNWKHEAYNVSIHMMSGIWWVQGLIFVGAIVAALFMLVGRHTKIATFVSWFLLASLHARNPLILHGGDQLLRVMLFWSLFVPLGRAVSVDALLERGAAPHKGLVTSFGTLALKLQLCGMYWFSAGLKWHPAWVEDGTAVLMAMKLDQLVTPFGRSLTQWPELLEIATFGTMWLETLGPALAFSPVLTAPLQLFAVLLFVGFHLVGLAPALYLGTFPWVCAACWLIFIPAVFWDRWSQGLPGRRFCSAWGRNLARFWMRLSGATERPTTDFVGADPGRLRRVRDTVPQVFVALLIVYVGLWNLRTLDFDKYVKIFPRSANVVGDFLQLGQYWNLFAPFPATEDGWFVFAATTIDGEVFELRSGAEVSFDKPANVSESLGPKRWKKYMMNLGESQNGIHRRLYGNYLCRDWNRRHSAARRLASVRMFMVRERTLHDGSEEAPMRGVLWNQVCVLEDLKPGDP